MEHKIFNKIRKYNIPLLFRIIIMFKKTIIAEFFTTVSFRQALDSLYLMTFGSYKLKKGVENKLFEQEFLNKIGLKNSKIFSFYSGRNAIYNALRIIGINKKDEIIVSSYTCSVVVNAVLQSGGIIKYCDIEKETLGLDLESLKNNITKNTKVIIIQHTFGKQAKYYDEIIKFAQEKNILVIEDCAHSLGNNGGNLGDFLIFSSGRDKVISSVTGGFLVVNNKKYFLENIKLYTPSIKLIFQNLLYNIVGYKAYRLYDFFKLGRVVIFLSRKLNLITEILNKKEKNFEYKKFNLSLPNSLAYLAVKELNKLDEYTKIRLNNSKYYLEKINNKNIEILFEDLDNYNGFRFPILLKSEEDKNKLIKIGRNNKIIFGNQWSGSNIIPAGIDLEKAQYKVGSCPLAEDISKRILTLPNHKMIREKDLKRVVEVLNNFSPPLIPPL